MRLIDFTNFKPFKEVKAKMGIPEDYNVWFHGEVHSSTFDISIAIWKEIEEGIGHEMSITDININESDSTFEYQGKKVIVYIRDQYMSASNYNNEVPRYKYHLCWCNTIQEMYKSGRYNRYVVSRRKDGTFIVNLVDRSLGGLVIEENKEIEMQVCRNCLRKLDYSGYASSLVQDKNKTVNTFSVEEYLNIYDTNFIVKPKYNDSTAPLNVYPENWKNISLNCRQAANWICEECGKEFSSNKSNLHTHHEDGNKYNNQRSNLRVLCRDCHNSQPFHGF